MTEAVLVVFGCVVVVGMLTRGALIHSVFVLKAVWMRVEHSLIQELLYEFELDHNTTEATKNIC